MGSFSRFLPPTESYLMKLQQLVYKIEELKALVNLYEQMQQGYAQATVLRESMTDESEEQLAEVDQKLTEMNHRFGKVASLMMDKTGGTDVDDAVERVQAHITRLQQIQQIRGEQLQLRTQLDLELALGDVAIETRQQAENALQGMQVRMEKLVQQGEQALPGPRLVTLT